MTKKLKIIGPYTPEHPGPFCTRDGKPVRVFCRDVKDSYSIVGAVLSDSGQEAISTFLENGRYNMSGGRRDNDLMNAREVPVAREFWLADNKVFATKEKADFYAHWMHKVIHVREVLPGDEE